MNVNCIFDNSITTDTSGIQGHGYQKHDYSLEKTLSQKLSIGKEAQAESDIRPTSTSRNSSPKKSVHSPKKNSSSTEGSKFSLKKHPKSPAKGKLSSELSSNTQINSSLQSPSPPPPSQPPQSTAPNNSSCATASGSPKRFHLSSPSKSKAAANKDKSEERPGSSQGTSRPEVERSQSVRLTRKIFHNWRSAICDRTKDKTKDFIRRWKTLPENHQDFDPLSNSPQGSTTNIIASGTLPHHHPHGEPSSFQMATTVTKGKNIVTKKVSDNEILVVEREKVNGAHSHDEGAQGGSGSGMPSGQHNKSSVGWSVHVWATYVQRGSCDGDGEVGTEEEKPPRDLLSDFQKVKLTHFFRHVLDMNHDDVIAADDFVALNQRIRHFREWSSECIEFHILKEVHSGFLECFLNQPLDEESHMFYCSAERETRHHVNIEEWLDVWGSLLSSARSMEGLPLWLQYFPKILFQVINKSGSGTISKEELRAFYTMFLGIDFRIVNETLDSIYAAMTDGGPNIIQYSLFKLCFANFLLAKYPHGPGQYLFGICAPHTLQCSFPIDYSALNTPRDDLEPYDPEKDKEQCNRRSVIV